MPELPEVEVLSRYLRPGLVGREITGVAIYREKSIRPGKKSKFMATLKGARFEDLTRRAKYLVFSLRKGTQVLRLLGHLGMTGRMYLARPDRPLPKHAAVVFDLGQERLVFEDTRYFGRLTLDGSPLACLGPEPLSDEFTAAYFAQAVRRFRQAIKVKLLDQTLVAGLGNIYACEALFRACVAPATPANRLSRSQVNHLVEAIREVLTEAVAFGSTVPLNWHGPGDGLFYYGRAQESPNYYEEKLAVYDREGRSCVICGGEIRRLVQAGRSTYFCPECQRRPRSPRDSGKSQKSPGI